jgi:hypothetical protein
MYVLMLSSLLGSSINLDAAILHQLTVTHTCSLSLVNGGA